MLRHLNATGLPAPIVWGHLARGLLAAIFLWSGIAKSLDPTAFLTDIESFQLLPYRWAWLLSIWLPYLEITAAAALLTTRKWAQAGAVMLGGLLLVFLVSIVSAWSRGLSLSCGCFGPSTEPANYPWLVTRDVLMLGLAAFIFLTTKVAKKCEVPAAQAALTAEDSASTDGRSAIRET